MPYICHAEIEPGCASIGTFYCCGCGTPYCGAHKDREFPIHNKTCGKVEFHDVQLSTDDEPLMAWRPIDDTVTLLRGQGVFCAVVKPDFNTFYDAARTGDLVTVKRLIKHVDPTAMYGSALAMAVQGNQKDVVEFLLTDTRVRNQKDLARILWFSWYCREGVMSMVLNAYNSLPREKEESLPPRYVSLPQEDESSPPRYVYSGESH